MSLPNARDIIKFIAENPEESYTSAGLRKIFHIPQKSKQTFRQMIQTLLDQRELVRGRDKVLRTPRGGHEGGAKVRRTVGTSSATDAEYNGLNREQRRKDGKSVQRREYKARQDLFEKTVFKGKLQRHDIDWMVEDLETGNAYAIPGRRKAPGREGDLVLFELYDHPRKKGKEQLAKVISHIESQGNWAEIIKDWELERGLVRGFEPDVVKEVRALSAPSEKDFAGRLDLRGTTVICIDPDGARDHDDAISIEKKGDNWELGVHIADVSHYVTENTAIDQEALERSFTQYLPWVAMPMLPEELSSGWCSLRENEDRLALSCIMQVSADGVILSYTFAKTVMRVTSSLTYEQALQKYTEGDSELTKMVTLTRALRKKRQQNGILELGVPEMGVRFNEQGEPEAIVPREALESYQWIEDCMLAANQCCAKYCVQNNLAGLYRVHEAPDNADILELYNSEPSLFQGAPYTLKGLEDARAEDTNIQPAVFELYRYLISKAEKNDMRLHKILRSMKKARYSHVPSGHFALNWTDYAHYTSPIRRYADLWVHRRISEQLAGKTPQKLDWIEEVADQVSGNELSNLKNERAAVKVCAVWLIRDKVGEEFEGTVSGIGEIGIFVRLDEHRVEGLLRYRDINGDYFIYEQDKGMVRGKRSGLTFVFGTKVRVQLVKVDCTRGEADLVLLGMGEEG
jgi:ribonuclease R